MSQRREEFLSTFLNNLSESNIKSILRKSEYHDSNISESLSTSAAQNVSFYDNRTGDEWTTSDSNQRRSNSGLTSKSEMDYNRYANMPIYPDEEMQASNSLSVAEKSKQYNSDLYVQALIAKSDLGLIDKVPVSSALEALRAYGPRQQSPVQSPVHRNWFENVQQPTSSLPDQYGSSHIKSASIQLASAFSTSINSGRESPYSKENMSFQKTGVSENFSSGLKTISEVVLQSVDDEDEYLYGDSNPLPDEPQKSSALGKCTSEVQVKGEVSGWSDDEDIAIARNLKSSSLRSFEKDRKFTTSSKADKRAIDMKSDTVTWKNPPLSELHSQDKRNFNSDINYEKDAFLASKQKDVALSVEKVARTFIGENKIKSSMSNYQRLHFSSSDISRKLEDPKNDLQSTSSPKVSASELKSKYHAAADILKKGIASKKSSSSEISTPKEPSIMRKDSSLGNRKSISEIKVLLEDKSDRAYGSPSSSKFPKLLINIEQGEKKGNKRVVRVKNSERASVEHSSSKKGEYGSITRSGGIPDKYFDDKGKKGAELFLSDMEKSTSVHRIIRDRADGNNSKRLVQHSSKSTQEDIRELPKAYSLNSDRKRSGEHIKHQNEKELHSFPKEKKAAEKKEPKSHSYERRSSRERSPIRWSPDRYHSPRLRSPGRVSRHRSRERSPRRSRERSPRRRSRTRRDSRSPRRKSRSRRESRSPKRSFSPRKQSRDSSPYRSRKRDQSHYHEENSPRRCHERRSENFSLEVVSDESSDDEIDSETSLDRESKSPSRHSKERQVERISSDKNKFHVKTSGDVDNFPEHNSSARLKNTSLKPGTAKVEKILQIASNRSINTSEDLSKSKSELLLSEADSSRSSLEKDQLLMLSDGMKRNMSPLTDNSNASGQVNDMVQLFEMMQNTKMLNDLSQAVEEVKQAKQASQQSVPLESSPAEDANMTVEPVSAPQSVQQPLYSQTYSYNAHVPTSMPPPFPVDNNFMYPSYPPPISTSAGYNPYPPQFESYAAPFQPYAAPYQPYAPQPESYVPQSQSYAPQPQPYAFLPAPESYSPDALPTIPTQTSKRLSPSPVPAKSSKRSLPIRSNLKSVPVDKNISSASKKKAPIIKKEEQKHPEQVKLDKPSVPAAAAVVAAAAGSNKASAVDNNAVLDRCKKLSEERDVIQKKLRNTSDAIIELKKLREDLETTCRKTKSTADKQTLNQCRSLFDKAGEELNALIADAKRIDSELKREKAKLPKDLVKFNYKTEVAETKQTESAVTYTCFDTGAHWCQHCNEQFSTISTMLEHLHKPTHKQNVGRDERPWTENKIKKEKQPEGQDNKNLLLQPTKGLEFLKPFSGFYCCLCEEALLDHSFAELHVKNHEHTIKYLNYCKENPIYERKFDLVKKVGLAAMFKEKRKRFLEEKQQNLEEKQQILVKRRKLKEDTEKKIKEKIEKQQKNEKLVEELEEVNADQSSSPQKMLNIKLTLVNEKEKKPFDWKKNPKESETKMKPQVVYIGRAPNFKPRPKPADKNSSSNQIAGKESTKELSENISDPSKSSKTVAEEGNTISKHSSEKIPPDTPTSTSGTAVIATSKLPSKSLNSKVSETLPKNKDVDIPDKSKICVSGCQRENEARISSRGKVSDKPVCKSLAIENDKRKHNLAKTSEPLAKTSKSLAKTPEPSTKTSEPVEQNPLIDQAIRNILYGDDGSKSGVQIFDINLPAPPPSQKLAPEKASVVPNKAVVVATDVIAAPKPNEPLSFNAKPQKIVSYVTTRNTDPHKILTEEEKDFLLLGIDKSDLLPLAVPKPPPSALIQNHNELPPNTVLLSSFPTSSSNSHVSNVNASDSSILNPVNVGENISHAQHIPVQTPTKTLPPFPPPIQIPPPNVVVKYTPPPIVTIPKPNPCELNNVSCNVFNTLPQHTHFTTTVPSYTVSSNIAPIREKRTLLKTPVRSWLVEVPFNDVRDLSTLSQVNYPSTFNQEYGNAITVVDPQILPVNPEIKSTIQTIWEYSNTSKASNMKEKLLTSEIYGLKAKNVDDINGKTIAAHLPSPLVSLSTPDIKDDSNICQNSKLNSVTAGTNNDLIHDDHTILISGLKTEVDAVTDDSQSCSLISHSDVPRIRTIGGGVERTCFEILLSIFDAVENNSEYACFGCSNSSFSIKHPISGKGISKTVSSAISKEIQNSEELFISSEVISSENRKVSDKLMGPENIDFKPDSVSCDSTKKYSESKIASHSSPCEELQINVSLVNDELPGSVSAVAEEHFVKEISPVVSETKEYLKISEIGDGIPKPVIVVPKFCTNDDILSQSFATDDNACTSVGESTEAIFSISQTVSCPDLSPMAVSIDNIPASNVQPSHYCFEGRRDKTELENQPDSHLHLSDDDSSQVQKNQNIMKAQEICNCGDTENEIRDFPSPITSVDGGESFCEKTESVSLIKMESNILCTSDVCEFESVDLAIEKKINEVDLVSITEFASPRTVATDSTIHKKITELDLLAIKEYASPPNVLPSVENVCDVQPRAEHLDISMGEENNLLLVENEISENKKEWDETLDQHLFYENVSISSKTECEEASSNLFASFAEGMELENQESSDLFTSPPEDVELQNQKSSNLISSFSEDMKLESQDSLDLLTSHAKDKELESQDKSETTQDKNSQILEPIQDQKTKSLELFSSSIISSDIPKSYLSALNPNVLPCIGSNSNVQPHISDCLAEEKMPEGIAIIPSENKITANTETRDSSQNTENCSVVNQSIPAKIILDNQVTNDEHKITACLPEKSCTFSTNHVTCVDNDGKSEKSDNAESDYMYNKLAEEITIYIKEDFNTPPLTEQSSSNLIDCINSSVVELEPLPPHLDFTENEEISILKNSEVSKSAVEQMHTSAVPSLEKYDINDSVLRNTSDDPPILMETASVTKGEHNNEQTIDFTPEESCEGNMHSMPAVITPESLLEEDQDIENRDLPQLSAMISVNERKKKTDSDTDEYETEV